MTTISSATSTATTTAATTSASTSEAAKTQFLQLLTTQLKNQNPLNPTDPSEFTSQLVQYAGLEQQMNTNTTLDTISSNLSSLLTQVSQLASQA
ncbi:flagellar hook assembly protein FlgD [Phenylobacterium aquaticum]|uniref:flagellar hook assembly protein FlgD n=1 Tax=Phenylobacterium aquaticum TaxID=1763816 RepID=UPI001F5D0DC1|nr:flagellar hook capping FlgD N-terminal domain-containing protein [Phenylobacterium aquaticum]MCI3131586.1 flagellar hook capping protein [Phenylobacterium aquaticum]